MAESSDQAEKYSQSSIYNGSREDFEHSCGQCLIDGNDIEAHGLCIVCNEYLCITCFRAHGKNKASRHHTLLGESELKNLKKSEVSSPICTYKCPVHTEGVVIFYCTNHKELCCNDCVIISHNNCQVVYIPETCLERHKSTEYQKTLQAIDVTQKTLDNVKLEATKAEIERNTSDEAVHEGYFEGIKEENRMIKHLQDEIVIKQHTIKYPQVKKYFDCIHGKECVTKVQSNTPCTIEVQGFGFMKSLHDRQSSVGIPRHLQRYHLGYSVSVDARAQRRQYHRQLHTHSKLEETNDTSEDSCTLTIYAESKDKTEKAIKSLEQTVKKEWIVKTIEDPGIHRLSLYNIKEIKIMAGYNHVDISVDTDLGNIKAIGLVANVLDVYEAIHSQLRSADKSFYLKGQAQLMSNVVKWIYIKDQKEFPFPSRVNLEIENAYRQKHKKVKIKDRSGGEYEIDFGNMTERDVKQGTTFTVIRRDIITGATFNIPKHWKAMEENENLKLVQLNATDSEYTKVLSEFTKTLGRQPQIVMIERIQNKTLYTKYAAKRKEMNVNNPKEKDNEKILWHGTTDYLAPSINSHGFNRSYPTGIGQGVHFAVNANYSDHPNSSPPGKDGNKRVYRCLVLTGKYCNGSDGIRFPPPIDQSVPHIIYDSVTDNTWNPTTFVVFNDTQAYLEHLITYR